MAAVSNQTLSCKIGWIMFQSHRWWIRLQFINKLYPQCACTAKTHVLDHMSA